MWRVAQSRDGAPRPKRHGGRKVLATDADEDALVVPFIDVVRGYAAVRQAEALLGNVRPAKGRLPNDAPCGRRPNAVNPR